MVENKLLEKSTGKKRLVVIDGNHLIHRAFYAIQASLQTSSGEQTNAIYGFASMVLNIIEIEKPDYIAMTFDEKAPTFRHDEHEEYKGTRKKAPDELYTQIPRIREFVERFNMPVFSKEGYEADDMMGTLAILARKEGLETFIVTGDMDVFQLINGDVYAVTPHKGYRDPIVYNRDKVIEKYGITPEQVVDYKALVGDTSDNIKGVEGIGPKGATKLLEQYQTLDNIYAHLDEIPETIRLKLERDKEQAYFAKRLATLVTDIPIEFDKEKDSVDRLDFKGAEAFFTEMEMGSLKRRLNKLIPEEKKLPEGQMSLF